jgi:nucleoside 2-deoxyribosyltransferase
MIDISPNFDQTLCWANNPKELMFYVKALLKRELIEVIENLQFPSLNPEFPFKVMITSKGWDYLEEKKMNPATKNQAFVAMSFSTELNKIWTNGIKPAVERAGYKAYRMDKEPHNERIDAKIIAEIQDSKFLIADVTGQKQGVYYEAGFAQGLKLPVLWCVKKDELGKVHFDTRQFSHIEWENAEDLKENLFNLICATVGRRTGKRKD